MTLIVRKHFGVHHRRIGKGAKHLWVEILPNVKDEPRLWLARLLRSRRRDSHGRWLWRLVRPLTYFRGMNDALFFSPRDVSHGVRRAQLPSFLLMRPRNIKPMQTLILPI